MKPASPTGTCAGSCSVADEPTSYSGDATTVLDRSLVSGREASIEAALDVARMARRELAIFSHALAGEIFSHPDFLETVRQLAISGPHARVRVLVTRPSATVSNGIQLLTLIRQLSSHMEIRVVGQQHRHRTVTYIIADDRALIYHPAEGASDALVERVPGTARHYLNQFEDMWEHGQQDRAHRGLSI